MLFRGNNNQKAAVLAAIAFCLCVWHANIAHASGMPVYKRLQPVTSYVNAPSAVALDNNGNIYVAESINKHVRIYSQSGNLKETLQGFKSPVSVAVDGSGRIYVGDKTGGYVAVYDSGLSLLFKLGSGDGEFIQPNDIAVDSSGKIYVVDTGTHTVNIYNPDGSYSGAFGEGGSGTMPTPDGKFNRPTSIEISEAAGEIIVLDHGLTYDSYGTLVDGARIQKFTPDGSFRSSLSKYGSDMVSGEMFRPQHLAVDSQGRIYVTDTFYNVVLVYGDDGNAANGHTDVYLGALYDLDFPLRIPTGTTIGKNNKLYIASLTANRVDVYGTDSYTNMAVSPLVLNYADGQCTGPAPQAIGIFNNGTAVLNWTASTRESWITLSAATGSTQVSGVSSLNIGVAPDGLAAGQYLGTVSISATSGDTEIAAVELTAALHTFIANAGAPYTGTEGQAIVLDASSSSGCIISYDWDILNDGTYEYASPSPTQTHTFASQGLFEIRLRVTDNAGSVRYAAATAGISDSAPAANFTGAPLTGTAPLTVQFSNSSSGYDQPLTYQWDLNCDATADSAEANPSFTYEAGTHSVCLTVKDADGSDAVLTRANYITVNSEGCQNPPVKIGAVYYSTLQDAYNDAADGVTIQSQAVSLDGDLSADRNISISLAGGYDCLFTDNSGKTILNGTITISNGTVLIGDVISQ